MGSIRHSYSISWAFPSGRASLTLITVSACHPECLVSRRPPDTWLRRASSGCSKYNHVWYGCLLDSNSWYDWVRSGSSRIRDRCNIVWILRWNLYVAVSRFESLCRVPTLSLQISLLQARFLLVLQTIKQRLGASFRSMNYYALLTLVVLNSARMGIGFSFSGIGALIGEASNDIISFAYVPNFTLRIGGPIDGALATNKFIWWRPALFSGVSAPFLRA